MAACEQALGVGGREPEFVALVSSWGASTPAVGDFSHRALSPGLTTCLRFTASPHWASRCPTRLLPVTGAGHQGSSKGHAPPARIRCGTSAGEETLQMGPVTGHTGRQLWREAGALTPAAPRTENPLAFLILMWPPAGRVALTVPYYLQVCSPNCWEGKWRLSWCHFQRCLSTRQGRAGTQPVVPVSVSPSIKCEQCIMTKLEGFKEEVALKLGSLL